MDIQLFQKHPTAIIDDGAIIGENTKIWHWTHIRENAKIGDNCIIGQGCYIDHDVMVGKNVKIQNGVSVYYGVTIEDNVFVGPNVTFINDKYPRSIGKTGIIPTLVKQGASIGANATILCGIELGEYCMIGAGAVVTKHVKAYAIMQGNPARFQAWACKSGQTFEDGYYCKNCQGL